MKRTDALRTFDGAVALVTGGASGIGRALGEALARRGGRVVLADRQGDLAQEVAARIRANGGQAAAEELDVTDFPATSRLVEGTFRGAGRLDYLFNNAGVGVVGEARLYALEDWYRVLDVNLRGVIHGVQAAYPVMLRQGFGHLLNTASFAGLFPSPLVVGYCATKHAVVGLSTSLRIEAAASGVRVSVLCPGPVRTQALLDGGRYGKMLRPVPPEVLKALVDRQRPSRPSASPSRRCGRWPRTGRSSSSRRGGNSCGGSTGCRRAWGSTSGARAWRSRSGRWSRWATPGRRDGQEAPANAAGAGEGMPAASAQLSPQRLPKRRRVGLEQFQAVQHRDSRCGLPPVTRSMPATGRSAGRPHREQVTPTGGDAARTRSSHRPASRRSSALPRWASRKSRAAREPAPWAYSNSTYRASSSSVVASIGRHSGVWLVFREGSEPA
jgi:NAD(P)-dependent dehydrogenase (short-subunit alcohol dehydrogenase family)